MGIKYPTGYPIEGDRMRIAVAFPKQLFHDIIAMAKKENKSFNDMVIDLVKCGKFDLEESDRHELPGTSPRAGAAH